MPQLRGHLFQSGEGIEMTKHTPGPWEVGKHHGRADGLPPHYMISQSGEMYDHAIVFSVEDGGEGKANANLVAAAPDLLHELKMTHAALMISKIGHYADSPQCERTKAAIAKATQGGEPQ